MRGGRKLRVEVVFLQQSIHARTSNQQGFALYSNNSFPNVSINERATPSLLLSSGTARPFHHLSSSRPPPFTDWFPFLAQDPSVDSTMQHSHSHDHQQHQHSHEHQHQHPGGGSEGAGPPAAGGGPTTPLAPGADTVCGGCKLAIEHDNGGVVVAFG